MNAYTRYTKAAGNTAIYARVRNLGQYWNFVTLAWVSSESADTERFLLEYPDATDALQSFFAVPITPPAGVWPVEIVEASGGQVIAAGDTQFEIPGYDGNLTVVPAGPVTLDEHGFYS
jgi:hypothetical protein